MTRAATVRCVPITHHRRRSASGEASGSRVPEALPVSRAAFRPRALLPFLPFGAFAFAFVGVCVGECLMTVYVTLGLLTLPLPALTLVRALAASLAYA